VLVLTVTFTLYCVPLKRPVTVLLVLIVIPADTHPSLPVLVKTSYPVKVPQVLGVARRHAGATHDTASVSSPGATLRFSTAPVDSAGLTDGDTSEALLVPAELVAVTVIV
jgi:hypothetical protein